MPLQCRLLFVFLFPLHFLIANLNLTYLVLYLMAFLSIAMNAEHYYSKPAREWQMCFLLCVLLSPSVLVLKAEGGNSNHFSIWDFMIRPKVALTWVCTMCVNLTTPLLLFGLSSSFYVQKPSLPDALRLSWVHLCSSKWNSLQLKVRTI